MLRKWLLQWIVRTSNKKNMFIHVDYRLCVFSVLGIGLRTLTHTKHRRPQLYPQPTALNIFDPSWLWRDAEPTGTEGQPPCILWLHHKKFSNCRLLGCSLWFCFNEHHSDGQPWTLLSVLLLAYACRITSFSTRTLGVSFVGFSLCPAERSTPRYWTIPLLRTFSMDSMSTIVQRSKHTDPTATYS